MAEITRPSLADLWAQGGARQAPTSQKVQLGWVSEIPPYQSQNWWQNRVDNSIAHIFQRGILEWNSSTEYFKDKSYVNVNGKLYVSLTNNINKPPLTSPSDWKRTGLDGNDIPNATTSVYGIVRLADALTSTSSTDVLTGRQGKTLQDTKLGRDEVVDGLGNSDATKALSANQGKVLNDTKLNKTDVIDALNSSDPTKALSASQGKALNDGKIDKISIVNNLITNDSNKVLSAAQGVILQNNKFDKSELYDALDSTSATKALTANQGKILNDIKFDKSNVNTNVLLGLSDSVVPTQKAVKTYVDALILDAVPVGGMMWWPVPTIPIGWVKVNGQSLSKTSFNKLFAVLGTTFGDGGTTFKLPDVRGRFIRCLDEGAGIDIGRVLGSVQATQNLWHNHNGATGGQSVDHFHYFSATTSWTGDHDHAQSAWDGSTDGTAFANSGISGSGFTTRSGGAGGHSHAVAGNTSGSSTQHSHVIAAEGGNESRPHNIAFILIMKYA